MTGKCLHVYTDINFLTVSSSLLQAGVSHQYCVALRDSTVTADTCFFIGKCALH